MITGTMADLHATSPHDMDRLDNLLWIGYEVPDLKSYVMDRWDELQNPPEPYSEALARFIAESEQISPEHVWVLNSRWEGLQLITQYLSSQNGLIVNPSPLEYTDFFQNARIKPHYTENIFPFTQFTGIQGCILSNPNVWNGQMYYSDELEELLSENPHCIFVIDERMMPFTEYPDSLASQTPYLRNLVLLRSVEDRFGLSGLGLSYALGHPKLLRGLKAIQNPYSVSRFAQLSGMSLFRNPDHPTIDKQLNQRARQSLEKELKAIPGVRISPSYTHYLSLGVEGVSASALAELMEESAQVKVHWEEQEKLGTQELIRIRAGAAEVNARIPRVLENFIAIREAQKTEKS